MISYSIIQKSQLEGALRMDAEYYQPEYLEIDKKILTFGKYYFFGELIEGFNSGKNWPQKEHGQVKFIRTQHIKDILIRDEEDLTFCDGQPPQKILLREGDLLFVRVGGVSDNSVASKDYEGYFYSDNVLRIRIQKLNPFFVSVFLNSYYGKSQLEKVMKGIAQPLISRENFEKLKIPEPSLEFQREIEENVLEAYNFRSQSLEIYSQAENLLLEELGLKNFKIEDDLFYIVNLSEIKFVRRADAEYFQPKYKKILNQSRKKYELVLLNKTADVKRGSLIDPKFYDEIEGTPYIRGKDFSPGHLEIASLVYISKDFKLRRETRVKAGDIVFASIGSVGTSALVPEEFNNSFISNNTGKISIRDKENLLPEYLIVLLHSVVGKLQFEKESSQTAQPKVSDVQVRNFTIPILPKLSQQKIADLVQKSHQVRKKAKQLLEQAKQKVENLIEGK